MFFSHLRKFHTVKQNYTNMSIIKYDSLEKNIKNTINNFVIRKIDDKFFYYNKINNGLMLVVTLILPVTIYNFQYNQHLKEEINLINKKKY